MTFTLFTFFMLFSNFRKFAVHKTTYTHTIHTCTQKHAITPFYVYQKKNSPPTTTIGRLNGLKKCPTFVNLKLNILSRCCEWMTFGKDFDDEKNLKIIYKCGGLCLPFYFILEFIANISLYFLSAFYFQCLLIYN